MVKNKDGSWNRTSPKCNYAELKEIMRWVSRTQPTLRLHEILDTAGFRINGLRRPKSLDFQSQRHTFLWSEDVTQGLAAGLCTCQRWEVSDIPLEKARIAHRNHALRAQKVVNEAVEEASV